MNYQIELENFAGPLDLLLFFIRRDEIDIMDIPISHITEEYLSFIEAVQKLNISFAGDFILMAATLMRIKAKMLLDNVICKGSETASEQCKHDGWGVSDCRGHDNPYDEDVGVRCYGEGKFKQAHHLILAPLMKVNHHCRSSTN